MSTLRVNTLQNTSTTDGGISINNSGHVTVDGVAMPSTGPLSNRNLIINGAMQVAQRGTSSTTSGYGTVDRFQSNHSGGGAITASQVALTSGDPYDEGFRYFWRNTNTTTSTAAGRSVRLFQYIEAQDLASSGWDYVSSTSYVTLSFWVRSSVAQEFYGTFITEDGTRQVYPFSTGSLSADTWTKVTKTIPGNSNITVDNDNGRGLLVEVVPFYGTDFTDSGVSVNTWAAFASATRTPDMTSTWANTTDATFDITGVQLEVGSVATPFEHRSYGDELLRCQRYYWNLLLEKGQTNVYLGNGAQYDGTTSFMVLHPPVTMRTEPSADFSNATGHFAKLANNSATNFSTFAIDGSNSAACITVSYNASGSSGHANFVRAQNTDSKFAFSAEL